MLPLLACAHPPSSSLKNTASPHIYTLSLHDALPILALLLNRSGDGGKTWLTGGLTLVSAFTGNGRAKGSTGQLDRKSTRLNSSHRTISYAVFCLKKKTAERNGHDHGDIKRRH